MKYKQWKIIKEKFINFSLNKESFEKLYELRQKNPIISSYGYDIDPELFKIRCGFALYIYMVFYNFPSWTNIDDVDDRHYERLNKIFQKYFQAYDIYHWNIMYRYRFFTEEQEMSVNSYISITVLFNISLEKESETLVFYYDYAAEKEDEIKFVF